ncbi:MAG: hypothetical protein AB7P69_04870 [Candidatus Binatia bacterium]
MNETHNQQEQKLEALLRARRIEPASPDLVERIVLQAQQIPQKQTIPLRQWIRRLFSEFHLPRPVYVFACTLIFGIVVGFNSPFETPTDETDAMHVQSFLYADEDML